MRAPACATASLHALERLLADGAVPSQILIVASTFQQARLFEHLVDTTFPVGSYELTSTSVWGLSAKLLATSNVASDKPVLRLRGRAAASAWFKRIIQALPLRRYRPANDPTRYAAALENHFDALSYAGVSPDDYLRQNGIEDTKQLHATTISGAHVELAAAYASFVAIKQRFGLLDRADVLSQAVIGMESANNAAPTDVGSLTGIAELGWRHVIASDGHNLSPAALRVLATAFPPFLSNASSLQVESAENIAAGGTVQVFLDPSQGPPGQAPAWGASVSRALRKLSARSDGDCDGAGTGFAWSVSQHDESASCGHPSIVRTVGTRLAGNATSPTPAKGAKGRRMAAQAAADPPTIETPTAAHVFSKADLGFIGADYVQRTPCGGGPDGCAASGPQLGAADSMLGGIQPFIETIGVPPTASKHGAGAKAVYILSRKLLQQDSSSASTASAPASLTVCVACRSHAYATALHAELRNLLVSQPLQGLTVLCDGAVRLADVEEVRVLLGALGCLAQPADHRHVFNLATSALYALPVPAMAALLQQAKATPAGSVPAADPVKCPAGDLAGLRSLLEAHAAPGTRLRRKLAPGEAPAPPASPRAAAFRRLLDDLDDLAASYNRTRSAASTLARFARRSGLAGALSDASSSREEAASSALAALLQLCGEVEAASGGGQDGPGSSSRAGTRRAASSRGGGRSASKIYQGSSPAGAEAAGDELADSGLPFLFSTLQSAVLEEGVMVRQEPQQQGLATGLAGAGAESAPVAVVSRDEDEQLAGEWEVAPLMASPPASAGGREPSSASQSARCADALDAVTALAVSNALERSLDGDGGAQLGFGDFKRASSMLAQAAGVPPGGVQVTVVITTEWRALSHQYDVLMHPWASDSTLPGPVSKPALPLPEPLFAASRQLAEFASPPEAGGDPLFLPHPRSAAEHEEWARARVRTLMTNARLGVLFVAPSRNISAPASSSRRSRFLNELFGPAPMMMARAPQLPWDRPVNETLEQLTEVEPLVANSSILSASQNPPLSPQPVPAPSALLPMSFTSLSEYEWCPHRYFLSRVAKVPQPQPVPAALLYGRALHEAVATFAFDVQRAAAIAVLGHDDTPPSIASGVRLAVGLATRADAREAFRCALASPEVARQRMLGAYDAAWAGFDPQRTGSATQQPGQQSGSPRGHSTDHLRVPEWQAAELRAEAAKAVDAFYEAETTALAKALAAFDSGGAPVGPDGLRPCLSLPALVERRFSFPVEHARIQLTGVLDRVDVLLDCPPAPPAGPQMGSQLPAVPHTPPRVLVREFKTSMQWRDPGHLGRRGGDSKQLSLYAMALRRLAADELAGLDGGSAEASVLATLAHDEALPVAVSLESVETGEKHAVSVGRKQAQALLATLASRRAAIEGGEFTAKVSPITCSICPFHTVCQHAFGTVRAVTPEAATHARELA